MILPAGTIKRIHVNKHILTSNAKNGENEQVITVQTSKGPLRARRVSWDGPTTMVHDADHPLNCGAKVWVETRASVTLQQDEVEA